MLPSIDAPQGDHVDRTAPINASATPADTTQSAGTGTLREGPLVLDRVLEQRTDLLPGSRRALGAHRAGRRRDEQEVRSHRNVVVAPGLRGHHDGKVLWREL